MEVREHLRNPYLRFLAENIKNVNNQDREH